MSVYKDYPNLKALPINERVLMFKETVSELLKNGKNPNDVEETIELFVDTECYEAAQGCLLALTEFRLKLK